jgi:DNA ligase (NAD+)
MINIPTTCPVCSTAINRINDILFCTNDLCEAKSSKKLLHFIKTMKIKGLGEKTLEKLDLSDITDLYDLSLLEMNDILGEKIGTKLYNEITGSKTIPLATFIQSFGVPLIGNSASTKLANHTDSLWDIHRETCEEAGIGNKATNNLLQWINKNESRYRDLPIMTSTPVQQLEVEELYKVVITGKLNDYSSRAKAKDFLETKGVTVMSGISSKVNYLVCDIRKGSSSETKAEKLNIPIISMNDLLNKINGDIND